MDVYINQRTNEYDMISISSSSTPLLSISRPSGKADAEDRQFLPPPGLHETLACQGKHVASHKVAIKDKDGPRR
jgi:hypothetical protein